MGHSVVEVRSVGIPYYGGWMSALESENIAIIGRLIQNTPVPLDAHNKHPSRWAVMKAVLSDAVNNSCNSFAYAFEIC
jgi:hypothetical protein